MRLPPVLALCAAAAGVAGCPEDPGGKGEGEACASEQECRSGLVCFERSCARSYPASAACTPPGTPTLVYGGEIAAVQPAPGACVTTVRDPVPAGDFVDLGEHAVGTRLSFDVPSGTSSFTVLSQEVGDTAVPTIEYQGFTLANGVVPTDVREPGGALFFSDTEPYPREGPYSDVTGLLAYSLTAPPVVGTFTVPNTSAGLDLARTAGELPVGTWTFTVNDWARECLDTPGCTGGSASGTYRVHVSLRRERFASTGTLDLEVYLATDATSRLSSGAAAVADAQITRWVQSLGAVFGRAGICLGTVRFYDLPAWAKTRYAPGGVVDVSGGGLGLPPDQTPPGCDDMSQLFTVGVAQRRSVHLFLADELVDAFYAGRTVLGVDGSIPGPSGAPGTVSGGAVVGVFDLLGAEAFPGACSGGGGPDFGGCGTDMLAYVAAHEAGHWLGLYHTSEYNGAVFDPLGDTARCPCVSCAPFSTRARCAEVSQRGPVTEVTNAMCSGRNARCGGGRNLMFWLFDQAHASAELTGQQAEVMRLNAAVR